MRLRSLLTAGLAVAIATPAPGMAQNFTPSEASVLAGSVVLMVPFSLAYASGASVSGAVKGSIDKHKRWRVAAVRPQGQQAALELRSEDGELKIDTMVDARIVQAHKLQAGDALDIEAIGQTGYAVKKGATTITLLAEPNSGMIHSKARS